MAYSYRCGDYPGMESCPGSFTAETEVELWKHIELHAKTAHDEDPTKWSPDDRDQMKRLIL
jgi:predicted small metal-binding protein